MGAEQDDQHAAWHAEMERVFQILPAAGTVEYWRRIEHAAAEDALPLEVLARCVQERARAGKSQDAERVFDLVWRRIQRRVQHFARSCASMSPVGQSPQIAQDIEQECYVLVWNKLASDRQTFLVERFTHALDYELQHAAHAVMEREGIWLRSDVARPRRVPVGARDSIEAGRRAGDNEIVDVIVPDPRAMDAYSEAETRLDLAEALRRLDPVQQRIVYDKFYRGLTDLEIAESLGLTDRAVRYRLATIYKHIRTGSLGGEEEAQHDA